jgi:cytochrome b involved in lipid metabolism
MSGSILLVIEGHRYDVTKFAPKHPGEGIRDTYIRYYKNKDVSDEFDRMHFTNEPWEILEKAREKGEYNGVKYLGKVT